MIHPKFCCGTPPLIFSGTDSLGEPVHSVVCLLCGKIEISSSKENAVQKFNNVVGKGDEND